MSSCLKIQTSPLLAWERSHRHLAMHGLLNFKKKQEKSFEDLYNTTMEQIQVKPLYTEMDYEGMTHLDYMAGVPPFLRGPYSTMYVTRPWTVRQYAGFSTAEESNAFYRRTWQRAKKVCLSPLTLLLTAVMTPIILV